MRIVIHAWLCNLKAYIKHDGRAIKDKPICINSEGSNAIKSDSNTVYKVLVKDAYILHDACWYYHGQRTSQMQVACHTICKETLTRFVCILGENISVCIIYTPDKSIQSHSEHFCTIWNVYYSSTLLLMIDCSHFRIFHLRHHLC